MGASASDSSSVATIDQLRSPYSGLEHQRPATREPAHSSVLERRGAGVRAKRALVELSRNSLLRTGKEAAPAIRNATAIFAAESAGRRHRYAGSISASTRRGPAAAATTRVLTNMSGPLSRIAHTCENRSAMRQPIRLHRRERRNRSMSPNAV
jgi:hypothetical protein